MLNVRSDGGSAFARRHPRIAALLGTCLLIALVVFDASRAREARLSLGPEEWRDCVVVGLGGAAAALLVMRTSNRWAPWKSFRAMVLTLGFGALLIAFVWSHPRHRFGPDAVTHSRSDFTMLIAGDAAIGIFVLVVVALKVQPRLGAWVIGRRPAVSRLSDHHAAEVWHVVDDPGPRAFDPYFVAHCSCDWIGPTREGADARSDAFADAREHCPNVSPAVVAPMGG